MSERIYPDPSITMESEEYWKAANEGRLLIKRCSDCNEPHFFPRAICPHCMSGNTVWEEASGKGRVYTFSPLRRADPPYAIAYVTLAEGVTMLTNLVDMPFDDMEVGMEVEVTFKPTETGQALPLFRRAGG